MSSEIRPHHRVQLFFVKALDPQYEAYDNTDLLEDISGSPVFTVDLYERALNSQWCLESIYAEGEEPVMVEGRNGKKAVMHGWTAKGTHAAWSSLTILSSYQDISREAAGVLPSGVFIPESLFGRTIKAAVGQNKFAEFEIRGIGFGTSFSCCPSEKAVDFQFVALDKYGKLRSQPRPSEIFCGVVTKAYAKDGLVMIAGPEAVHMIEHKIREITGDTPHCGHDIGFSQEDLSRYSHAAPSGP